MLIALVVSLLAYVLIFSSNRPPPQPLSSDALTAAGQWLLGSLLAALLAGGQQALAGLCLAALLCGLHALLRSVSFTSRTHAKANIAAGRTPIVQLIRRMEQQQQQHNGHSVRTQSARTVAAVDRAGRRGEDERRDGGGGVEAATQRRQRTWAAEQEGQQRQDDDQPGEGMLREARHERTASLKEKYKQWKQEWQQSQRGEGQTHDR